MSRRGGRSTATPSSSSSTASPASSRSTAAPNPAIDAAFDRLRDAGEDVIGPEQIPALCKELGVEPEDVLVLVMAFFMGAERMGYIARDEWHKGFAALRATDVPGLKTALEAAKKRLFSGRDAQFDELYRFAFNFCRESAAAKVIDRDTAAAMLELVMPDRNHVADFAAFLRKHPQTKAVNLDLWNCFLTFSKDVGTDFSGYDDNSSWPTILDEFVEAQRAAKS